jgi:hypothetical protein
LYLSGRGSISTAVAHDLEARKAAAGAAGQPVPLDLAGVEFDVKAGPFKKYPYCLEHPKGLIGVSPSGPLPAVYIQPRAEFIHACAPKNVVSWYQQRVAALCGDVVLSVSRVDLHADWQGWQLTGDDRRRFVSYADNRHTYEEGARFSGFEFGTSASHTVVGRI